ncbi:MAG: hypothetical protein ACR2JJ_09755 [Sphingomicrobium sp.]
MTIFFLIPHIGETISMELIGRGQIGGQACWVRGGQIGVTLAGPTE